MQAEVGGIDHADQQVGQYFLAVSGDDVSRHGLIARERVEAVSAGQVQDADLSTSSGAEHAFLALHGDAGVIGHLLPAAGEQVEERRLAAVRIAQQGDAQGLLGNGRFHLFGRDHPDECGLVPAQGEGGVAHTHGQRFPDRPALPYHTHSLTGHKTQFQQA